jgi:hypothetical protein
VAILRALRNYFGCGSVYFQKDTRPNHQQCYRYEVYRWDDLTDKIIPFFKKHKPRLVSKKHDFDVFVRMMRLLNRGAHKTATGMRQLYQLKQQMH